MTSKLLPEDKTSPAAEEIDSTRRQMALGLLGALGGASLLQGCAVDVGQPETTLPYDPEPEVAATVQALTGTTGIRWVNKMIGSGSDPGLVDLTGAANEVAILTGYSAAGDGRGGVFAWSSTNAVHNGTTVINRYVLGAPNPNPAPGWRLIATGIRQVSKMVGTAADPGLVNVTGSANSVAVLGGYYAPGDGGGGVFMWSTASAVHNRGTVINPYVNGAPNLSPAPGWRRICSGATNVRWFGAKGDLTNDHTALQKAIDYATEDGATLFFPAGYYKIQSTLNVGLPLYANLDFLINRTDALNDGIIDPNMNWSNFNLNKVLRPPSIVFETGAFLVPDFAPANMTPALAYNLDTDHGRGSMLNVQVVGMGTVASGKFEAISTPATNKIVGLFLHRGCGRTEKVLVAGLQCGIAAVASYWCAIRDVHAHACDDALSLGQCNSLTVSNLYINTCRRGIVFCGSSSAIASINTDKVENDLVILAADCSTFGPGTFRYSGPSSGGVHLACGGDGDGSDVRGRVTHCNFTGLRMEASGSSGKRGIKLFRTSHISFIGCRTHSARVEAAAVYALTMLQCDFDFEMPEATWIGEYTRQGELRTMGSDMFVRGNLAYPVTANFGTIPALGTVTYDLAIPATTVIHNNHAAQVQVMSGGSTLIRTTARLMNAGSVRLYASNPTTTPIAHSISGVVSIQLLYDPPPPPPP